MRELMRWENVIFLGPLLAGIMIVILSLLSSFGDHDVDVHASVDIHADTDVHLETDHSIDAHGIMSLFFGFFGIGHAPLGIVIMTALFLWGITGFISNQILGVNAIVISLILAFIACATITGRVARLIGKLVPNVESHTASGYQLWDRPATVLHALRIGDTGFIRATNQYGHQLTLRARLAQTELSDLQPGVVVRIEDYDENADIYTVTRYETTEVNEQIR